MNVKSGECVGEAGERKQADPKYWEGKGTPNLLRQVVMLFNVYFEYEWR